MLTAASSAPAGGMNVYYIAYNRDMTVEYIRACAMWARAFNYAASEIEEGFWEEDEDDKHIKTYTIKFPDSGFRVVALSSRPSNLRGRQGIIVIDEAAFHEQLDELLKAALAMLIWGGKVRVISTHDGDDNPFNTLIGDIRAGRQGQRTSHYFPRPWRMDCSTVSACVPGKNGRKRPSRRGWHRYTNSTVPVHRRSLTVFRPTVAELAVPLPD